MNEESQNATEAEGLFHTGLNCSQSVFVTLAGEFGLDRETAAKIACGLGGGVGRQREVCGAVTGAVLAIGMAMGADKMAVYPAVQEFSRRFREQCGSIICRELLAGTGATTGGAPEPRTEAYYRKRPCGEMVRIAVEIFEQMKAEKLFEQK